MRVLVIDPGLNLGYAAFASGEQPRAGSYRLPGSMAELGSLMVGADATLSNLLAKFKPDVLGYAELFIKFKDRPENVGPMFAIVSKLEELAVRRRLRCVTVREREAREAMALKAHGRKKIKLEAMTACRNLGWPVIDDHSADALVVGAFVMSLLEQPVLDSIPAFLKKGRQYERRA